jgi:6-phosphogluconolactonase
MDEQPSKEDRKVLRDPAAVAEAVAEAFRQESRASVDTRGKFHVALSGGKTPRLTYAILNAMKGIPWDDIQLFIGDERAVPLNDERSNYRMVRENLLPDVEELVGHIHHLSTFERSLDEVASKYQGTLQEILGPECIFDLVLLGVRPDGSTAGLLPGRPETREQERFVVAVEDPADGPNRVSLAPPALLAARKIWVIAAGPSKADVVARTLVEGEAQDTDSFPAAWIRQCRDVTWFLDEASASGLK